MNNVLDVSLYKMKKNQFDKINDLSKKFLGCYCRQTIVRDSIFGIIVNYVKKKGTTLELIRYPFKDEELWAFTFVKRNIIFLCINTELSMCKQIFAAAHELYHIQCYLEDNVQEGIVKGSLLNSRTIDDMMASLEDLEANAFAGLLLMPDVELYEQIQLFGIDVKHISLDDILVLMELFALPYKAVILRLMETELINEKRAKELFEYDANMINKRIEVTGKAAQWTLNSKEIVWLGSLLENFEFNSNHDFITESRKKSDQDYINNLKTEFFK